MAGSTLGQRGNYVYTSDSGTQYAIQTLVTLGTAASLTPLTSSKGSLPRRFRPRVLHLEATISNRQVKKKLICEANNAQYKTDAGGSITVDGTSFTVTGRTGERVSYPVLSAITT